MIFPIEFMITARGFRYLTSSLILLRLKKRQTLLYMLISVHLYKIKCNLSYINIYPFLTTL